MGIVAWSGKIQGTVLLNNNVARVWRKTKTVRDTSTNYVKGIFSGISAAFKTLTPAEILAWNNAAVNYLRKNALAEVKSLTGAQAFQRVNNILTSLSVATVTSPPGIASSNGIIGLSPVASEGGATITCGITLFTPAVALAAGEYIKVYATPQYTASKSKFSKSNFRYIGFYTAATAINPLSITAKYIAAFGAPVLGQRIGLSFEWITTNGTTNFKQQTRLYTDVIVGA